MALQGLSSLDEDTAARVALEEAPTSRDLVPDDEPSVPAPPTTRPASSPARVAPSAPRSQGLFLRPHVPDQTNEFDALT